MKSVVSACTRGWDGMLIDQSFGYFGFVLEKELYCGLWWLKETDKLAVKDSSKCQDQFPKPFAAEHVMRAFVWKNYICVPHRHITFSQYTKAHLILCRPELTLFLEVSTRPKRIMCCCPPAPGPLIFFSKTNKSSARAKQTPEHNVPILKKERA